MKLSLNIRPFTTPNFITLEMPVGLKQGGLQALPTLPISDVDEETLEALCKQFRDDVFAKRAVRVSTPVGQCRVGSSADPAPYLGG